MTALRKADRERMAAVRELGCIACSIDGYQIAWSPIEVHHLVDKGYRKHSGGHQATIPLCQWHHRGVLPKGFTTGTATAAFGPSMALAKRHFNERYGTQRALLEMVNEQLRKSA